MPQDLIERVIYAATRASNTGNSQDFIVVRNRNPETKRKIRDPLALRLKVICEGCQCPAESLAECWPAPKVVLAEAKLLPWRRACLVRLR